MAGWNSLGCPGLPPESLAIQAVVLGLKRVSKVRLVMLIEAGTHLIVDALMCPTGLASGCERKLLRSVRPGMLLMWDRAFYVMVESTLKQGCDYPVECQPMLNSVEKDLDDGSYLMD